MSKTEAKKQLREIKKFYESMRKPSTSDKNKLLIDKRLEALSIAIRSI